MQTEKHNCRHAQDMALHGGKPNEAVKTVGTVDELSDVAGHATNVPKSVAFLHTDSELSGREI